MNTPFWFDEEFENICRFGVRAKETLFAKQSEFQRIEIFDTAGFGRVLALDGLFMTSERDEYLYHELLVHPVLTTAPRIERVLVIGGGDGGTVREVLSYPDVKEVVMVEIDGMVVEACKTHLSSIGTAWEDPRLEVIIGDGLEFVKDPGVSPFDVILLDHSDPVGPAEGLFDERFYRDCKACLKPDGIFCLQSESSVLQVETFAEIQKTLHRIYKGVHPYFGSVPIYASGAWTWTYASDVCDPFNIDETRAAFQEARCRKYNRDIHRGAFAVPNELKPILKSE